MPDLTHIEREVRFAVVVYGGVSLAVYMNGVTQEMLHLVRSTHEEPEHLSKLEKVYLRLACLVGEPARESKADDQGKSLSADDCKKEVHYTAKRPSRADWTHFALEKFKKHLSPSGADSKAQTGRDGPEPASAGTKAWLTDEELKYPTTKFVVDILAGTSAGGINAIYLAKALTTGASLNGLAKLWITAADLSKLLNDGKVDPKSLKQTPPPSLLNSPWMYLQLLRVLNAMSKEANARGVYCGSNDRSMVEALDLYCTTTDLNGLPVLLPLTDKGVRERRYKSDFHFRRRPGNGSGRNDLSEDMDPFLAFAARCTSSFPIAFEPMMLEDVAKIVDRKDPEFADYYSGNQGKDLKTTIFGAKTVVAELAAAAAFENTCPIYLDKAAGQQVSFDKRAFADGGYLHNKPFSYAIETLKRRSSTVPVDRKLMYLEPEPEAFSKLDQSVPRDADGKVMRQNAIQNGLDALLVLPRYQTIREDIQSVVEWNSNISRLRRVIEDLQDGVERVAVDLTDPEKYAAWQRSLEYSNYLRLRLSGAADQVAALLAGAMKVETDSVEGSALRVITGEWRDDEFGGRKVFGAKPEWRDAQSAFLNMYDFEFLRRGLRYLRTRLIRVCSQQYKDDFSKIWSGLDRLTREYDELANEDPRLDLGKTVEPQALKNLVSPAWLACLKFVVDPTAARWFMEALHQLDGSDHFDLGELLSASEDGTAARVQWLFNNPDQPIGFVLDNTLAESVVSLGNLKPDSLRHLREPGGPGCRERLKWTRQQEAKPYSELLRNLTFRTIRQSIADQLKNEYGEASGLLRLKALLGSEGDQKTDTLRGIYFAFDEARRKTSLDSRKYNNSWREFEIQDALVYPIIFGTDLGEFETVDLFRISPKDTEGISGIDGLEKDKVAPLKGSSLMAFGGFLDQRWRLNDMFRGRLDGADRLITAILPDSDPQTVQVRQMLIREAQTAIVEEWEGFERELKISPPKARESFFERSWNKMTGADDRGARQRNSKTGAGVA
jgi:patatin-related protein